MATRSGGRPAPWPPPSEPPAPPHDLCCHPQPPAAWSPGKQNTGLRIGGGSYGQRGTFSWLCAHLAEGPEKPRVRHGDNGERHSKAEQQVYNDVGHDSNITAVPVRSTRGSDPLKVKTSPSKQRGCVPHKGPDPGEHHPGNSMSEDGRKPSRLAALKVLIFNMNNDNNHAGVPGLEEDRTHGITHNNIPFHRNDSYRTQTCYSYKNTRSFYSGWHKIAEVEFTINILTAITFFHLIKP